MIRAKEKGVSDVFVKSHFEVVSLVERKMIFKGEEKF
jgi:hypothetical protein